MRSLAIAALTLSALSAGLAQTPPAWVGRSDQNAQILIGAMAKHEPEAATSEGVPGLDDQISGYAANRAERLRADLRAAQAELQSRLAAETDPLVKQDLDILIAAAGRELRESEADEKTFLPYADVASVTLVYPREAMGRDLDSTGFLVPAVEGLLLVGCSWLSAKWPHLSDPSVVLVRAMVGRDGDARFTALSDEELVERVHSELVVTMGMRTVPKEAMVQRWPRAMPQYTVGHQDRLDRIDHDLAALPALALTGAAYRGVGVASCVSQADRTADALLTRLDTLPAHPEGPS